MMSRLNHTLDLSTATISLVVFPIQASQFCLSKTEPCLWRRTESSSSMTTDTATREERKVNLVKERMLSILVEKSCSLPGRT